MNTDGRQSDGRTWILGDSIIRHAGKANTQLHGGGTVIQKGVSGARLAGLGKWLRRYLAKGVAPTTLILHLGTNDILKENLGQIRNRVKESLEAIRNILPNTRLIWSDILLRAKYQGEVKVGAGKRCTLDLNMFARKAIREMPNTHVIKHSHIINPSQ